MSPCPYEIGDHTCGSLAINTTKYERKVDEHAAYCDAHYWMLKAKALAPLTEEERAAYHPPFGAAACPCCDSVYLDSDHAANCCEDQRSSDDDNT